MRVPISSIVAMKSFPSAVFLVALTVCLPTRTASAWTVVGPWSVRASTRLFHAPEKAPRHDVGGDPFASLTPDQKERVQAYMEHQQNVPKPGFPADVRSLVQYNHGFAVMSTNSKA